LRTPDAPLSMSEARCSGFLLLNQCIRKAKHVRKDYAAITRDIGVPEDPQRLMLSIRVFDFVSVVRDRTPIDLGDMFPITQTGVPAVP